MVIKTASTLCVSPFSFSKPLLSGPTAVEKCRPPTWGRTCPRMNNNQVSRSEGRTQKIPLCRPEGGKKEGATLHLFPPTVERGENGKTGRAGAIFEVPTQMAIWIIDSGVSTAYRPISLALARLAKAVRNWLNVGASVLNIVLLTEAKAWKWRWNRSCCCGVQMCCCVV